MSILDDAIREHLELKRAHGADDVELKRLEDEAFGPPQRPDEIDPFAEAPTEFLASPGETPAEAPALGDEAARSGRRPDIADLQEAPPAGEDAAAFFDAEAADAPSADAAPAESFAPLPDAPPPSPADAADAPPPPPADEAPSIVDQPTQMFDVQAHVDAEAAEAPATGEQASPTDEELLDAAQEDPHAAPPAPEDAGPPTELYEQPPLDLRGPDAELAGHPPAEAEPEEESAEYDFFNEQRLSDELDQALEAPLPPTDEHIAMPRYEDAPAEGGGIFDFESEPGSAREAHEDDPSQEVLRRADAAEASEEPFEDPPRDGTEEAPLPAPEPPSEEAPGPAAHKSFEEEEDEETEYDPDTGHEDVLEDTPRFLEDAPEDDDLWFEQKPPKDFDLD